MSAVQYVGAAMLIVSAPRRTVGKRAAWQSMRPGPAQSVIVLVPAGSENGGEQPPSPVPLYALARLYSLFTESQRYTLAPRPMAGHRTLDPGMVVRAHRGQFRYPADTSVRS